MLQWNIFNVTACPTVFREQFTDQQTVITLFTKARY
jgi:hypothetical protein